MAFILNGDIADELLCDECGRYLSVGPVKITKDRRTLCGRCSAGRPGAPSVLNVLARSALFPCINRLEGCSQLLANSEVAKHEELCTSHELACEMTGCKFRSSSLRLLKHFKRSHKQHIIDIPELIFEVFNDFENTHIYLKENHMFYVTVAYVETIKTVSFSIKSAVDGSPVSAGICLKSITGETLYNGGAKHEATPVAIEISKMYFVKAVVVLSFDVEMRMACFCVESLVAKTALTGQDPPRLEAECKIFGAMRKASNGTYDFPFHIVNFRELSGDYVVASRRVLSDLWSIVVKTTRIGDGAREFLTAILSCTLNEYPPDFQMVLTLSSNISTAIEIRRTQKFSIIDGNTAHYTFENFVEYADILDRNRGLASGDTLKFAVELINCAVLCQPTLSVTLEDVKHCSFELTLTDLNNPTKIFPIVSNKQILFEQIWHVTADIDIANGKKFLSLTIVCDSESNNKIAFDIDVTLKSLFSENQIKETCSSIVGPKETVMATFKRFGNHVDIFDFNKGFITTDGTLVFHVDLEATNMTNSPVGAQCEQPLQGTTVINYNFNPILYCSYSEEVEAARDLVWELITTQQEINNKNHLSVYLHCFPERDNMIWACKANVTFMLMGMQNNISKKVEHIFHEGDSMRGFHSFAIMDTIMKEENGYLHNSVFVIKALLTVEAPKFIQK